MSAGRKRGDLRIYLQSPSGTRSTLLDVRPQDFSSSGFIDWPFMSVHFWGENPSGTWYLEVHNDAYSKWASEAKFFKWSLLFHGTEFDPNDDDYVEEKFNVVRDTSAAEEGADQTPTFRSAFFSGGGGGGRNETSPPSGTDVASTSSSESDRRKFMRRGCVSKQIRCTRAVDECRTLKYRNVANLICKCTPQCLEVRFLTSIA